MDRHKALSDILSANKFFPDTDGIYVSQMPVLSSGQEKEKELRKEVAMKQYDNYLAAISQSHSIPVMDHEVDRFLAKMPEGALILDIGGCWGWHWRRLASTRKDIGVLIIDFEHANLKHASKVLAPLLGTRVALLHADATQLPFATATQASGFHGVWTVQVFQHIPDFGLACKEACRVLMPGGYFMNYSLHITPFNRFVYRLFKKRFHVEGMFNNAFYLARASDQQKEIVKNIFGNVTDRYTELFFHPDLRLSFTGRINNLLGKLDSLLGGGALGKLFARQRSFESIKK